MKPNVDAGEIRKFAAQTAQWWNPGGEFKGLHDINPLRLQYIDARVPLAGKTVLDVGCGGGLLSEGMAARGAVVTGIDAAVAALEAARRHAALSGLAIAYRQATVEEMAAAGSERYDVVTCMELLEHVPDPESVVSACQRLVKPDGDVFFATLNRTVRAFLLAILAAEYLLGVVKPGTHRYRRLIRPEEIDAWASRAGLVRKDLTGLQYNPVLKKKRLGGGTRVNYLMHFTRTG